MKYAVCAGAPKYHILRSSIFALCGMGVYPREHVDKKPEGKELCLRCKKALEEQKGKS
jgi:hypothetical protein